MKIHDSFIRLLFSIVLLLSSCSRQNDIPNLDNLYLGQVPPGTTPELFAPGIVTTGHHEHSSPTFSPDGREMYWSVVKVPFQTGVPHIIMHTQFKKGEWQKPTVAPFSGVYSEDGPRFSPDGNRLYYYSKRPDPGSNAIKNYADIWFVEKTGDGWDEPLILGSPIKSDAIEATPSFTKDGILYFLRGVNEPEVKYNLYRSEYSDRGFLEPELLDERINSPYHDYTPFIAADESFLLFSSVDRPDGFGSGDIYVCFKKPDETWTNPINLGNRVNTPHNERFPSVSPDGKFLFFVSNIKKEENTNNLNVPQNGYCDIYWMDVKVIEEVNIDK